VTGAVVFASVVGAANIGGGVLVTQGSRHRDLPLRVLVAFGGGFMLGVAMLEMLPDAAKLQHGMTAALLGYLAVHLTQHMLTPHFHFGEETHGELMVSRDVGVMAVAGLLPHSFFDGVAIASGFLVGPQLGTLVFLAVLLHKVPTGVSLASVMLASGNSVRAALVAVSMVGSATVLGALVTPVIGILSQYGLALAAGVTIYVAASNLIPECQREAGWRIPGGVFVGVAAFWLVRMVLPGH
jgi:zinc transporter ZupT